MAEAPSLWCDLGLNYYHQSKLSLSTSTDQDVQTLLEKALQVFPLPPSGSSSPNTNKQQTDIKLICVLFSALKRQSCWTVGITRTGVR